MATRRKKWAFTPYRPPKPPPGSYDPGLDAQRAAAQRGLADTAMDTQLAGTRAMDDYGLQTEQTRRQADWNLEDLERNTSRNLGDIERQQVQTNEDFSRNIAQLTRNYGRLGRQQLQRGNQAGVLRGGAMLQSAAKRAENQQWDRQPIDTSYARRMGDLSRTHERTWEDSVTQRGRIAASRDWELGVAGLGLQRGGQDRSTALTRAGREDLAFGLDIGAQKAFQAAGAGWTPAVRPSNEFVDAQGRPYRVIMQGGRKIPGRSDWTEDRVDGQEAAQEPVRLGGRG